MKNCGQRFHNEVGKFRFLNELIKVVSPKVGFHPFVSPGPSAVRFEQSESSKVCFNLKGQHFLVSL